MKLLSELTKIRTVLATGVTLPLTFVISVGLGLLVGLSFRYTFADLPPDQQQRFDPLFATFYSLTLGQLTLVVFATLVVTSEYSSGTIRASLAAVPRRWLFYLGKLLAGGLVLATVSVLTVLVTFFTAQAALGSHRTSLRSSGVPEAIVGACLYLTLIGLFAMGTATMLRGPVPSLAILLPLLFLSSQGIGNVPKLKTVVQYLPDEAGLVIMHITGPPGDPRFGRDYGPWTGLGITALWTVAALIGGYLTLRRRDAR
jgi:ABC-type transport system involved in multi-copper enzyme maturation permease subunit